MNDQMISYLNDKSLLYSLQSGFRPSFSTDTCLINMSDTIRKGWDNGDLTGMVIVDLQKAFDTVDHEILLYKLKAIGLSEHSVTWMQSYLRGRLQL